MILQDYWLNKRQFTRNTNQVLDLSPEKTYLFELLYLSAIKVSGAQARQFLQGQLSCDVRQVTPTSVRQGAMCNLQGRILAILDVISWEDSFYLILPRDLLNVTMQSLSKTAMLSRVELHPATSLCLYGLYTISDKLSTPIISLPGASLEATSTAFTYCYQLANNQYVILIDQKEASQLSDSFIQTEELLGSLPWHQMLLKQKQIQIYPHTRGLFLPHRLDLHLSGHLSFDKGCYKGQEIIARTHYRAKLKHKLQLIRIQSSAPNLAGKKIFDSTGKQEAGEIIDSAPLSNDEQILATSILLEPPSQLLIEGDKEPIRYEFYDELNP